MFCTILHSKLPLSESHQHPRINSIDIPVFCVLVLWCEMMSLMSLKCAP